VLAGAGRRLLDALPAALRLDLDQLLEEDGTLFCRYRVSVA
jgi:hypothetical protein